MTITKSVTFIAKDSYEEKMKELLSAMVIPSKSEDGCLFYEIFNMKTIEKDLWLLKLGGMKLH